MHYCFQTSNLYQHTYLAGFLSTPNTRDQGGDDISQFAQATEDEFQDMMKIVKMYSKPLHVARFKKTLKGENIKPYNPKSQFEQWYRYRQNVESKPRQFPEKSINPGSMKIAERQ